MADESKKVDIQPENVDLAKAEKPKAAAPPPEKPLPGDCCGSGCVRCVWDIYYDELDEYDRLCEAYNAKTTS